ncbi:MAG: four helix bundle protein [Geobacteraceae bacterium]|nr:four helix bundle protein [Geobacteraceae bacterium]
MGNNRLTSDRTGVKDYSELIAYRKSYELVLQLYKVTNSFPKDEMFGLTSQMRRAAVSIPSNIAEGYMRGTKEYVQFLKIALGSAAELETQVSLSKDLGFLGAGESERLLHSLKEVLRLLTSYIKGIQERAQNRRPTEK